VVDVGLAERRDNIGHARAAKELGFRYLQLLPHVREDSCIYAKK